MKDYLQNEKQEIYILKLVRHYLGELTPWQYLQDKKYCQSVEGEGEKMRTGVYNHE